MLFGDVNERSFFELVTSRMKTVFPALSVATPRKWVQGGYRAFRNWIENVTGPSAPHLGQYVQSPTKARRTLTKTLVYSLIVFVGLIYGFMSAVFPVFLYLYMAVPIVFIAILIVWVLPERAYVPEAQIEWLFWAFLISLLLWPNYLAISLPGLPWLTAQRIFLGPMAFLLLVAVSTSSEFRARIGNVMRESPWISRPLLAFVAIQFVTMFFSSHLGDTANRFTSNQLAWSVIFFTSCFLFLKEGRAEKLMRIVCLAVVGLSIISIFEFRKGGVLWAEHIPSFLAVADESVQRMLMGSTRSGTGMYRLQGTYPTPLNYAEIMGLSTSLIIHSIMRARQLWQKIVLMAYVPGHFMVIWGTDSRLGMIGFFGSFLLYFFIWSIRRWKTRPTDILAPGFVLGYPAIIAGFLVLSLVWQRLGSMVWGGGAQQASNDARKAHWAALWPKLARWPFGHGAGNSGDALGYANGAGVVTVDSYYISVLLDYGVIGFFVFYGMLVAAMTSALSYGSKSSDGETQILMPIAVILGLFAIVKGVLSQEGNHALIFMLMGMVCALTYRARRLPQR